MSDIFVCQETKWNNFDSVYVTTLCSSYFDRKVVNIDALRSSDGYLIA
jgi:hypothetical protein